VLALAKQLEERERGEMSLAELEQACAEIGLDPRYVHKAVAQLEREAKHPERSRAEKQRLALPAQSGVLRTKEELLAWAAAFWLPPLYLLLAIIATYGPRLQTWWSIVAIFVGPFLLSWVPGFLTGRKWAGALFGLWFATCLSFMQVGMYGHPGHHGGLEELVDEQDIWRWIEYAIVEVPMGVLGAWVRARIFPPPWLKPLDRQQLMAQLFALQQRLDGDRRLRAFLSVDVVNSSAMKRDAPALQVEYSFGALREWIGEIVRGCGGEMQSAAGDGVMCLFSEDAQAARAARQLQSGIDAFNAQRNRLPTPFRIRCGISAGEVAAPAGTPIGHLDSPVIDRAAALQKRAEPGGVVLGEEASAAARAELGD
jgi:class 3 adenylate cyclase